MILAIDFGSTSIKAATFDHKLRQLTEGSAPVKYHYGAGNQVEVPVAVVEETVRRAIRQTKPRNIQVIAVTSQAQTHTVLDARGRAIRPFVSWQDARAEAAYKILKRSLKNFGDHCSFAELLSVLQVCQLKENPVGPRDMVVKLPTYFVRQWTGESVIDNNLAAMSGLYSLQSGGWWPAALQACRLREDQLPRLIPIGSVAAITTANARRDGLPAGIPIVLAGNDQTAGAYATRLETGNGLLLTLGSAQIAYACLPKLPAPHAGLIRGPYPGGLGYRMTADSAGGNYVNWAQTILAGCNTPGRFFECAGKAPAGCHGLKFEVTAQGERSNWQHAGLNHTAADFARSILERLSGRMREMIGRMGIRLAGRRVLVAGGGSQSRLWVSLIEKELGVRLHATEARPVLGAARMALPYLKK